MLAALACLFLAAHLPFLPGTPADIDAVNFALGVRDFDVARHQPHPPGYPVYMALSKVAATSMGGADNPRAVIAGLAAWSAIAGAALVILVLALFRGLGGEDRRAWWAMAIAVTCPLFWFTALRPLSDMMGLAAAVAAQALMVPTLTAGANPRRTNLLLAGAFVAGIAAGVRAQTVMLTAPLLMAAIVLPRSGLPVRARMTAWLLAGAGVLVWAVPLLAVSGGPSGYLTALGTQAGEDFGGVVMLWTSRRARVAFDAFLHSFVWQWGSLLIGGIVVAAAVLGALRLLWRQPMAALWLAVAFVPYAIFHLLFHETVTIRYALPLVIPVAFLAACAVDWVGGRTATVLVGLFMAMSLGRTVPAARAYGSSDPPAVQAMSQAGQFAGSGPVAMHAVFRRTAEWVLPAADVLRAPHGREWLSLVERWRADPNASMVFVADPRRTDLALFDTHARELKGSHRWPFSELPYVGGVRPASADWYMMRPPAWMLDRGWALSAEIGGVAAREAAGPHRQPSVAWVKARAERALLMVGGRNLDPSGRSRLSVGRGDAVIDSWDAAPGSFFRVIPIPAGGLAGDGYLPLSVRAAGSKAPAPPVSLEQFDLQPDGVEMVGFMEGWHEPEYNPTTSRSWRWMSERAVLWVRPIHRDITLTLVGESPLRYFDMAPVIRVSAAGQELARLAPSDDFSLECRVPASLLERAGGQVVVESDRWFVPAERGEGADQRHLALRVYRAGVR